MPREAPCSGLARTCRQRLVLCVQADGALPVAQVGYGARVSVVQEVRGHCHAVGASPPGAHSVVLWGWQSRKRTTLDTGVSCARTGAGRQVNLVDSDALRVPLPRPVPRPQAKNWTESRGWEGAAEEAAPGGSHLRLGSRLAALLALGRLLLALFSAGRSCPRLLSLGGLWSLFLRLQQGRSGGLLVLRWQRQWLQVIGPRPGPQVRVVQQQALLLLAAAHSPVYPHRAEPAPGQWR